MWRKSCWESSGSFLPVLRSLMLVAEEYRPICSGLLVECPLCCVRSIQPLISGRIALVYFKALHMFSCSARVSSSFSDVSPLFKYKCFCFLTLSKLYPVFSYLLPLLFLIAWLSFLPCSSFILPW